MKWNALATNWLWYFREVEDATERTRRSPYAMLGVGFYDYTHKVKGLIYPGNGVIPSQLRVNSGSSVDLQLVYPGSSPLDAASLTQLQKDQMGTVINNQVTLVGLVPTEDTRTAWTVVLGLGVEQALSENLAVDIRGRYNVVFGEISPLLSWGLDKVFPITLLDVGVSLKLYFE